MKEETHPKILIVEDDYAIRQSVEFALRRAGMTVKTLEDGTEVCNVVAAWEPDLILLDIMLPGIDGLEIVRSLRGGCDTGATGGRDAGATGGRDAGGCTTPIILMSALDQTTDVVAGLEEGADDYLPKPFELDELRARVLAHLRREERQGTLSHNKPIVQSTLKRGPLTINRASHRAYVGQHELVLRAKEFDLLCELALHTGTVCSREKLLRDVWGYEYLESSRTLDVHIARLRSALEEAGAPGLISTVHTVGYRFEEHG